jgi:uncharacterized protein
MVPKTLPKYIQPLQLTERHAVLQGQLLLKECVRLKELLTDTLGVVQVQAQFGQDEQGFAYVKGSLESVLHVQCQRCMQPMDYFLHAPISLSPVLSEAAAAKLPDYYEPLLLEEGRVTVVDMVEDEMLLSLPLVIKHADDDCEKHKKSG